MIACGKYHSLFLIDGQVWATGANKDGQIGNGTTQTQYKPTQLQLAERIVTISAWHSSAALTVNGQAYVWGQSNMAKPTKIQNQFSSLRVGGNFTLLTDMDGHIMQLNQGTKPNYVQGLEDNKGITLAAGGNFAFVIGKSFEAPLSSQRDYTPQTLKTQPHQYQ